MRSTLIISLAVAALGLATGCSSRSKGRDQPAASTASAATSGSVGSTTTATTGTASTAAAASTATPTAAAVAPSRFLYSANRGDSSISHLAIDATTGGLTLRSTIATADVPLRLVAHPTGRTLYAVERSQLTPLTIGPAGDPTPGAPVVVAGDFPMSACPTPDGSMLLVGYYGGGPGGSVRSFAVGAAGGLTPLGRLALGATAYPVDLVVHPSGRFAFAVDEIGQTITTLEVVPGSGGLVRVGTPLPCPDASALALDASGAFLVVMTSASPGALRVFAVGPTGALTPRGAPLPTGPHSPMAIARAPDGRFHVVTASSVLLVASIDPAGALTERSVSPVPAFGFPGALAIDASGRFVYTANFAGDDLSVLTVGPAGATAGGNVPIAPRGAAATSEPTSLVAVR